jgi:hypothetical protein
MCAHVRLAVLVVVFFAAPVAFGQVSIFESGPYLQQLTSHSVVVRVETENAEALTLTLDPGKLHAEDAEAYASVHSLTVDGLKPKTTYHYVVTSSRGGKEEGAFTTAPADDDTGDLHFVVFGDDRGGTGTHELIVKRIADEPIDFLLNTGDLVADGRIGSQWENFFDIEDKLLRDHCLFTAIGNHELVQENGASYLRYFGTPEEQQKHVFYNTFRWGFMRVFVLNGEGSFLGEDRTWLERELEKADTEPNLIWRVVLVHSGPFSSGLHGDNDKMHGADIPKLLRDHHVDFVFAGHDHIYERGASDGIRYIVTGGAGAPLYPIKHPRPSARKVESSYHYVVFDLGKDKGAITTKRVDGSIIEKMGFAKSNLWNDDGPALARTAPPDSTSAPATDTPANPGGIAPSESESSSTLYVILGIAIAAGVAFVVTRRSK